MIERAPRPGALQRQAHLTRRCVICSGRAQKRELIRLVCVEGEGAQADLVVDFEQKVQSRGAYIHRKLECVLKMNVLGVWLRAFRLLKRDRRDRSKLAGGNGLISIASLQLVSKQCIKSVSGDF